ncbi:NACHT domain-containing protein [Nitrogeniibacter aestuarii]|uniref:NACHT domain-containing protein n=1 Tax=Nitrogeniibacter aestuarii TaxID=2815343 RepID=UPI001E4F0EAB|nr:ATP-binding protein [Nitrogeniibacter aestuarii]
MSPAESRIESKPNVQRTFRDLSKEKVADIERASILARMGWSDAFGWDSLLESKRILMISEAGAGKTYECRAQQRELWEQGEPAFYLDLAQLATNNVRDLLSADEEARLDAWLAAQSDVATFFLDSIDELNLTLGSFETALNRLSKAVVGQLGRVRIIITTRPIAVDQQLFRKYFPVPDSWERIEGGHAFADVAMGRRRQGSNRQETAAPIWRNVALMPLSDDQIRVLAAVEGVNDADALLADILKRNAEDFARRPQDLVELCSDWHEHHRIRTHREQVEQNIRVKLKPRTDRREPAELSPDKALEGASRLALAAMLTRKLTIRLSVEADRGGEPGTALDPEAVLHDWTSEERGTLLERALFGFASYGRVRFHHRSVVEFLAAHHLHDRLCHGMPLKAVKRLLFTETPQKIKVVRPTMRPVAAWLAASHSSVFSEVQDREPEALLDLADPESLPLQQRVAALQSYMHHYGKGGWRGLHVPQVQVHRFASPDLDAHVSELWRAGVENIESRELLIELIGAGPMPGCANLVHGVAIDGSATQGERHDAIDALVRLDDPRVKSLAQSIVEEPALWPDAIARGAIVQLIPRYIAPDGVCEILKRVRASKSSVDSLEWVLPRKIAELVFPPKYLAQIRAGMTDLVTEGLAWEKHRARLVSKRSHLLPALAAVCLRLLREGETDASVLHSSVIALRLQDEDAPHCEAAQNLRAMLAEQASPLREAIFLADDAFSESVHPEVDPWRRLFRASYRGPLVLNDAQDGCWVRRILADPDRSLPVRTMMLEALSRVIWDGAGDPHDHIEGLRQYVSGEPELTTLIDRHLSPREIDPEEAELQANIERQRVSAAQRDAKNHADWVAFWREVAEHPETAFSADHEGNTAWNLWQAMRQSGKESRASGWNRRFIEQYFDKEVADRLRASMRPIWRNDRPTLPSERPEDKRGTILIRWQLGLAAIAAEAEDTDWAIKLSVEEAELAARYAPIELNGFPAWFEALARAHPDAVERTLGPDISAELEDYAARGSSSILLQDVSHAPTAVIKLFLPRLRAWLDAHHDNLRDGEVEAPAPGGLERVLEILLDHGGDETRAHIRDLAEDHLKVTGYGPFKQIWLTTLLRLDPAAGTAAVERVLAPVDASVTATAINVFGATFGERYGNLLVNLGDPSFTPKLLLRLTRIAYQHVRPCDDITREGTYSPGSRDWAQDGRNALLRAIIDAKGAEAWEVKLEMRNDPLFAHFRDRLALLAREKAAEEADGAIFSESEVATFNRYGEAPPTTRDDMFAMLVDRLDDLDDLLLQDVSPRAAWAGIRDEKVMRQQIALQLQSAANHAYTVDQEAVTADEKETDIRLRVASSGQQATIELKIGENWSGRQLRDTINDQLVTKYMAAETSRSGCLLVTVADINRSWQHPDTNEINEILDIDGLRTMLDVEAARIVDSLGGALRIAIKVLDLRPRLAAESKLNATRSGGQRGHFSGPS